MHKLIDWMDLLEKRFGKKAAPILFSSVILIGLLLIFSPGLIESQEASSEVSVTDPFSDEAVWLPPAAEVDRTGLAYASIDPPEYRFESHGETLTDKFDCLIQPYEVARVGSALVAVVSSIAVERSDLVEAGQVLAELESSVQVAAVLVAKARADMAASIRAREASLDLGARKRERAKKLFGSNIVSEDLRDEAATEEMLAAAELARAHERQLLSALELEQTKKRLANRTIRSPLTGVVVERHKSPGEVVKEEAIITVAQVDPLRVEVILPAALFGRVATGQHAEVWPESPGGGLELATVSVVDRVIDAGSGTFGVRLDLPNEAYAIPSGTNCLVRFLAAK